MGRKAVEKERKELDAKQKKWLTKVLPYFYENGVRKVTMDEIAEHLGVSKATIYNYFKSKEELIEAAVWLKLSDMAVMKDYLFNEELDFIERYYEGVKHFTNNLGGMTTEYLNELKVFFPSCWEPIQLFQSVSVENLMEYYKMGIERGVFSKFNIALLAQQDRVFFELATDASFLSSMDLTVKHAFKEYFACKFNGILTDKG